MEDGVNPKIFFYFGYITAYLEDIPDSDIKLRLAAIVKELNEIAVENDKKRRSV